MYFHFSDCTITQECSGSTWRWASDILGCPLLKFTAYQINFVKFSLSLFDLCSCWTVLWLAFSSFILKVLFLVCDFFSCPHCNHLQQSVRQWWYVVLFVFPPVLVCCHLATLASPCLVLRFSFFLIFYLFGVFVCLFVLLFWGVPGYPAEAYTISLVSTRLCSHNWIGWRVLFTTHTSNTNK